MKWTPRCAQQISLRCAREGAQMPGAFEEESEGSFFLGCLPPLSSSDRVAQHWLVRKKKNTSKIEQSYSPSLIAW